MERSYVNGENGEVRYGSRFAITDIQILNGVVTVTATGHDLQAGGQVSIEGVLGAVEVNGKHIVDAVDTGTFDIALTSITAYTSGGTVQKSAEITSFDLEKSLSTKETTNNSSKRNSHGNRAKTRISAGIVDCSGSFDVMVKKGLKRIQLGEIDLDLKEDTGIRDYGKGIVNKIGKSVEIGEGDVVKQSYSWEASGVWEEEDTNS